MNGKWWNEPQAESICVFLNPFGFLEYRDYCSQLPVVAGSLVIKWKRNGKKAMAKGALTILVIGGIVMIEVTIWFISVLNSPGI